MSPVEFKKGPCRPVDFKGQGPQKSINQHTHSSSDRFSPFKMCVFVFHS